MKKKKAAAKKKLTPKQLAFVQEYIVDLNATQAAIRAGYSKRSAGAIGEQNLKKLEIQRAITEAVKTRSERTEITQDFVLSTLYQNVQRSMQSEPYLDRHGNKTGEYRYNGAVANKALELLGKHLGMWTEKLDINLTGLDYSELSDDQIARLRAGEDAKTVLSQP